MLVKKVFVYGSLRSDMFNYNIYLNGKVKSTKKGYINGQLFHLDNKGYPAVVKGNKTIIGELMELNDFGLTLKELDAMENYELDGLNNEYNRREVDVTLIDGSIEKAYFYEYNKDTQINKDDLLISIECGDWKEYMSNK